MCARLDQYEFSRFVEYTNIYLREDKSDLDLPRQTISIVVATRFPNRRNSFNFIIILIGRHSSNWRCLSRAMECPTLAQSSNPLGVGCFGRIGVAFKFEIKERYLMEIYSLTDCCQWEAVASAVSVTFNFVCFRM